MTDSKDINKDELLLENAGLIHRVVMHCNAPGSVPDLGQILQQAEENDWKKLVAAIRSIMSGNRDHSIVHDLDEEDTIIIESILNGIENPGSLPLVAADFHSDQAAPGIANLIYASIQGNAHSLNLIANTARQMLDAGGDFKIIAGRIRPMIEGERDLGKLTADMTEQGQKLMTEILAELMVLETE